MRTIAVRRASRAGRAAPFLFAAGAALSGACTEEAAPSGAEHGPPVTVPDVSPEAVKGTFSLEVDTASPALDGDTLEPTAAPVKVTGDGGAVRLRAFAKRLPARPGIVWIELFFEDGAEHGLRDVTVEAGAIQGADVLYDLTDDPFVEPTEERSFSLGRIAREGLGRLVLGVPDTDAKVTIPLTLTGTTSDRQATSSAPVAVSPDGEEAWLAWPDGDVVAVVDTASDKRVAQVSIAGRPTSVAVTPDGAFVLVAAASANTVSVIDRASRKVVQTFGEADGIGREPRHIVMSPDGGRAFVSAYVGDSVTSLVRNAKSFWVEKTAPVGRRPTGMSVSPDGGSLYVAHFLPRGTVTNNEAWMSVVATDPLEETKEVVFEDPFNVKQVKCLADVFGVSPSRLTTESTASEMWGVFLAPSGAEAWIPGARIGGASIAWERGPNSVKLSNLASIRTGELLAPFLFALDTRAPVDPVIPLLPGVLDPPDVSLPFVSCARLAMEIELISRDVIPSSPDEQVNRAAVFPVGTTGMSDAGIARFMAFTRGGRRMLTLAHVSDEVVVTDALTRHGTSQLHAQLTGSNPAGLALTPDGKKAYVVYDGSTFASVLDLSAYADPTALPGPTYVPYSYRDVPDFPSAPGALTGKRLVRAIKGVPERPALEEVGQIPLVDSDPLEPIARRGQVLFSSANPDKHPTLSATRLGACASCHPDGGTDGSSWGTMEGERRTISLRGGVAGRGYLHAMGTHANAREFASVIVKERLGGDLSEADIDALAKWVAFGIRKLQHPVVDDALADKGKAVFEEKCATCHAGEQMTSGRPDPKDPYGGGAADKPPLLFDVGTQSKDSHVILGPFFESLFPATEAQLYHALRGDRDLGPDDVVQQLLDFRPRPARKASEYKAPSLVGVWDNAVFFHDGRYDNLADAVGHLDKTLMLGLSADDKAAVLEYLHTL